MEEIILDLYHLLWQEGINKRSLLDKYKEYNFTMKDLSQIKYGIKFNHVTKHRDKRD